MAVTMAGIPNHLYQGLSGDTKPTDATVLINDIFYETDTAKFFVWSGAAWNQADFAPPMRTY